MVLAAKWYWLGRLCGGSGNNWKKMWSEIFLVGNNFVFVCHILFFLSKILFAEILGDLNFFWVGYVSPNHLVGTRWDHHCLKIFFWYFFRVGGWWWGWELIIRLRLSSIAIAITYLNWAWQFNKIKPLMQINFVYFHLISA